MRISQGQYGYAPGHPAHPRAAGARGGPGEFFYPAVSALLHPEEVRARRGRRARDRHPLLDPRGATPRCPRGRARPDVPRRRCAGQDRRPAPGRHAHRELGLFAEHPAHHARDGPALRQLSLMADDDPYELVADGEPTGVVELPPDWIRDDAVYFNMSASRASPLHAALGGGGDLHAPSSTGPGRRAACSCSPCTRTSSATAAASASSTG